MQSDHCQGENKTCTIPDERSFSEVGFPGESEKIWNMCDIVAMTTGKRNDHITMSPRRRAAGCARGDHAPYMPIEDAVRDCVTHHRSQPDPSLEAAVCGWSSSHTRVLRQEETADGHQPALGRHLGHRAGAE